MPQELPIEAAITACHKQNHTLALALLDTIFLASKRKGFALSAVLRPQEALEAYLRSCIALKRAPMPLDEMRNLALLPSSPSSDLWSLAVSAHSLAQNPRAAFEVIETVTTQVRFIPLPEILAVLNSRQTKISLCMNVSQCHIS